MKETNVNMYVTANGKYFNPSALPQIRQVLSRLPDDALISLETAELKDPTTMLLISLFLGALGVDRFMLGDTGMGILKLLTGGCCGILTIIDWFSVQKRTRSLNYEKFMTAAAGLGDDAKSVVYSVDATPDLDPEAEASLHKKKDIEDKTNAMVGNAVGVAKDTMSDAAVAVGDAFDTARGGLEDGIVKINDKIDEFKQPSDDE